MRHTPTTAITAIALALSLGVGVSAGCAFATKLSAQPLPREREEKDFSDSQEIVPAASRFKRRPDYRQLEAEKKQAAEDAKRQAEEAKLKAVEEAKRAQELAIESYKKRQQLAIEANNQGVALGKQGRWPEAIEYHEKAVQFDPQSKQFRINLSAARTAYGQQRLAAGDVNAAAGLFRKALAAAPDNGLAGKLLADSMRRLGREPESTEARLATGDQLAAVGDYEGASVEYQAAMQLEGSARTYVKMGDVAVRFGQVTTAMNWYRNAIVKDPDYAPAHRQLGLMLLIQKDLTGAAASLRKAVILDPRDAAAGQSLVEIWRKQVATNPLLAENHLGLAGALQLTGDFVGAESEYRKLEALDPKHPGLEPGRQSLSRAIQHVRAEKHKLAAETLFNQGLKREALAEITQAVMLEPRNAKYQFLLGECLEANGDYQGAHRAYLTCVLIDPENNQEAAARMREMQNGIKQRMNVAQLAGQVASQLGSPASAQRPPQLQNATAPAQLKQIQSQAQMPGQALMSFQAPAAMQHMQPVSPPGQEGFMRKNLFEGGPGSQAAIGPAGFRTHEEPDPAPTAPAPRSSASPAATEPAQADKPAGQAQSPALNNAMAGLAEAEAQKDYNTAVAILRQVLTGNLQNAEIHHRLAVNLLASGQITEAIAEFRIASALSPQKRSYADDLARAMVIHKRALKGDGSAGSGSTAVRIAGATESSSSTALATSSSGSTGSSSAGAIK